MCHQHKQVEGSCMKRAWLGRGTGTILAARALVGCAEAAGDASGMREATGDVSEHEGCRRVDGAQQPAPAEALSAPAANDVILLIGEAVGESEITVARYDDAGAGTTMKGVEALPVTG